MLPHSHHFLIPLVSLIAITVTTAAPPQATAYRESIAGTTVSFEMVPVPRTALFVGRTEVTWDMYDIFMLGLDDVATVAKPEKPVSGATNTDAVARPSQPYGAPDYGWGHAGFPVISVTRAAAEAFAKWLSQKTGREYRLPTEAEWVQMAALAVGPDEVSARRDATNEMTWHAGNAAGRTHAVASKAADRLGLFDLFGNAAEWVTTTDGSLVTRGGSFKDPAATVGAASRSVQDETWNERDPQLPKSRWWLSDGPFVGFRLVTARKP